MKIRQLDIIDSSARTKIYLNLDKPGESAWVFAAPDVKNAAEVAKYVLYNKSVVEFGKYPNYTVNRNQICRLAW